ncbi:PDDEXK family nuclease [Sphingomonas qomolangmaensis]|uniref:Uncharacterized protein n=1 Tax=Sphingomonas qomolangmaensis TaxID=2918765 RepID=A0ABY5L590_9SPHN|nr:hypothetical protein [Sphingomonas qomolangmaensis]UUL82105.1 hypothetical protein NMP03_13055 [Sphingomonas qomolangmaensis]
MAGGIAQDDARENRLIDLFNLHQATDRTRHGVDATLKMGGVEYEFELKSVTTAKGGVSTVRDLGPSHIAKWRDKHWIIAFFQESRLLYCRYGSPDAMRPWITEKWTYIKADFQMAKHVPAHIDLETMYEILGKKEIYTKGDARKLHKNQMSAAEYIDAQDLDEGYSPNKMLEIFRDRARYIIERGSTLNNPHIPARYLDTWPKISGNHAANLRMHLKAWRDTKP